MKLRFAGLAIAILSVVIAARPALAHHSFAAEYDAKKIITLKGVVARVDWMNPHSYFYVDVSDENGKTVRWGLEGYPPNTLIRTGWKTTTIKVGDKITVTGYMSRDGATTAAAREVTFQDGTKLFWGPQG